MYNEFQKHIAVITVLLLFAGTLSMSLITVDSYAGSLSDKGKEAGQKAKEAAQKAKDAAKAGKDAASEKGKDVALKGKDAALWVYLCREW